MLSDENICFFFYSQCLYHGLNICFPIPFAFGSNASAEEAS